MRSDPGRVATSGLHGTAPGGSACCSSIGSTCFAVGPFPGFVQLVGADRGRGGVLRGSVFFTSAATLQFLDSTRVRPHRPVGGAIQLAGTLFFNLSTGRALHASIDLAQEDRLIWAARRVRLDLLPRRQRARVVRRPRRARSRLVDRGHQPGRLGRVRRLGGGRLHRARRPATTSTWPRANASTVVGALCFLAGALLLLVDGARTRTDTARLPGAGGRMTRILLALLALLALATPADASTKIDYGPISHKGLKKLGGGVDEQEADAAARVDREPVRACRRRSRRPATRPRARTGSTRRCRRCRASTAPRRRSARASSTRSRSRASRRRSTSPTCGRARR